MIALLLACAGGGSQNDPAASTPPASTPTPPGPGTDVTDPFTPFAPGLVLVVGSEVVGDGGTIDLGTATVRRDPALTIVQLVNPTEATLLLPTDPSDWLGGDARVTWEVAPPASLSAGAIAQATLALVPDSEGPVLATLTAPGLSATLTGLVGPTPITVGIGRLGRVLLSEDDGLSFWSDTQVNTDPNADEWSDEPKTQDIAYGDGVFVAVGGAGSPTIRSSDDGVTWIDAPPPVGLGTIEAVAFGGGLFVITAGGSLATSSNGQTWIVYPGSWRSQVSAMVYAEGRFVAVGGSRRATTLDGQSWETDVDAPALSALTWGDGVFVAVGNGGRVATSDDGVVWTDWIVGTANRGGVAFGEGRFVSGGWPDPQLISDDGATFELVNGDAQVAPMTWVNGAFFGSVWPNALLRSTDGLAWTEVVASDTDLGGLTDITAADP